MNQMSFYGALLQLALAEYLREEPGNFAELLEPVGLEQTDYLPHLISCCSPEDTYRNYYFLEEEPDADQMERIRQFAERNQAEPVILLIRRMP